MQAWREQGARVTATAPNSAEPQTVLLILPGKKQLVALSTVAFQQAQAPRSDLQCDYQDALILDNFGILRRFEEIKVLGPWGDTLARRLLSRLTSGWRIVVRLSKPIPMDFLSLKSLVLVCLGANGLDTGEDPDPSRTASIRTAVSDTRDAVQLFDALRLPPPDQVLDVL